MPPPSDERNRGHVIGESALGENEISQGVSLVAGNPDLRRRGENGIHRAWASLVSTLESDLTEVPHLPRRPRAKSQYSTCHTGRIGFNGGGGHGRMPCLLPLAF